MTAAERNRRKRRLEAAGFKALPTGWVPVAYAERVADRVDAYAADVDAAAAKDLPLGRPKAKQGITE
jgi:hypothetical protein